MVAMLAVRVALSVSLVAFLVFAYWMGWIAPHRRCVDDEAGGPSAPRLAYSQYTSTNSISQTTSTKCQYHAAASNAKWWSGVKWPRSARRASPTA